MSRPTRRGIFFDLDGALADGSGAMRRAFGEFAAMLGHVASDADFAAVNGAPVPVLVAKLKRDWALAPKLHELIAQYDALMDAQAVELKPTPGAAETVEAAFRHGWKVGLVSARGGARSRAWLARSGLAAFVDVVVGGDEVCLGKPDPEPYLIALTRAGCSREISIAVDAAPLGVRAALAAGLKTFAVAPTENDTTEWSEGVRLIATLDEMIPELTRLRLRRAAGRR